jgi:biotin synthase
MMGNFLTTLGNEPHEDRAMFEELGLNVARQPDNAANPRPDNRSGWMSGETPDVVREALVGAAPSVEEPAPVEPTLNVRLWDPSTQLRFRAKRSVPPRPVGAANRTARDRRTRERPPDRGGATSAVAGG